MIRISGDRRGSVAFGRRTREKGRPIVGVIAGPFFGLFLAVMLQQFGVKPLDNLSVFGLPILGSVLGLGLAAAAPFGGGAG